MNDKLKAKLDMMPDTPGCYIYKDIDGNVLYVGKAKKLKSRVHQYLYIYNNQEYLASYLVWLLTYRSYYFFIFNLTKVAPEPPSLNPPNLNSSTNLQVFKYS